MQPILIICIISVCTLCGYTLSGTTERRKKLLTEILRALSILNIELGTMLNPLETALKHTKLPLFKYVANELSSAECVLDAWINVRNRERIRGHHADCLTARDLSALDRLFEQLGSTGREEQNQTVCSCILSLEESMAEAKDRAAQVGKLYVSLGFLAGIALVIIMI